MSGWAKGSKDPKKCFKCKVEKGTKKKGKKKKKKQKLETHGVQSQIVQMELDLATAKNLLFSLANAMGGELKKKKKKKKGKDGKMKWLHGGKQTRRIKLKLTR